MKQYDYLIVGSGLYGAVFAQQATAKGKKVLIIDKRPNIAGNIYTEDIEKIHVHKYGAHIFHTNNKKVWNYITQFAEFNRFTNSPVANYKGELYSLPFNMYTFNKMWGVVTPQEAADKIEQQKKEAGITEPKNLEEQAISLVGTDIYKKLIKGSITATVWKLFCIIMFAMGAAISIIVGRELGCGNREGAMDMNRKLMFVTLAIHLVMGALLIVFSGLIPELYNTEPEVRTTAARMLVFGGLALPFESLVHASYFTIRSGGKTWTTFAFDCGFSWLVTAPIAWALCTFTAVPVEYIYLAVRFADVMKLGIGMYLLKKGSWANTIIRTTE